MSTQWDRPYGPDDPLRYAPKRLRNPSASLEHVEADELSAVAEPAAGSHDGIMIDGFRGPSAHDPDRVPEPWTVPKSRSTIGILGRLALAAAVASSVAFVAIGKFPFSWTSEAARSTDDPSSFGPRFRGQSAASIDVPNRPAPTLAVDQAAPRGTGEAFPLGVSVLDPGDGAALVVPEVKTPEFAIHQLDPDEIAPLLKRGDELIASGDLAAARLVLRRAAEAGNARAAFALAGTYDPSVLERLGVHGFTPD